MGGKPPAGGGKIMILMVVGSLGRYRALTRRMHLMLGGAAPSPRPPRGLLSLSLLYILNIKERKLARFARSLPLHLCLAPEMSISAPIVCAHPASAKREPCVPFC